MFQITNAQSDDIYMSLHVSVSLYDEQLSKKF
jgi:hypothetical protein